MDTNERGGVGDAWRLFPTCIKLCCFVQNRCGPESLVSIGVHSWFQNQGGQGSGARSLVLTLPRPAVTNQRTTAKKNNLMKDNRGPKYARILLKLSGEALGGNTGV